MIRAARSARAGILLTCLILLTMVPAAGQPESREMTTYSLQIQEDGSALWTVEYRTLLAGAAEQGTFGNYTRDLASVYLPQFRELMERSASQAAVATGRTMQARDFTSDSALQSVPTGTFGVVRYSFTWTGFARKDEGLAVGDAFVGGLYLTRDHTLIIHPPTGYAVQQADPAPDRFQDGLVWYGMRSFGPGEPEVVLAKEGLPLLLIGAGGAAGAIVLLVILLWRRRHPGVPPAPGTSPPTEVLPTGIEVKNLEDRILLLLEASGGEMYQSEMTQRLGMPKSTVSAALASLHERKAIVKVKKGRENLIRISREIPESR
ncbi:MAG: helix-turn-helix domain-containing protein [Methanomicrobiales archaeon]|nr:helix-turn-helix domain-containing protein [Methanomicrobiales archaeon]MDD1659784.1 helix-turn-helix domain-containing protein [Methanomicrobiales archaeon]